MPNIMEISGLLSGRMGRAGLMDLRNALGRHRKKVKVRRGKVRRKKSVQVVSNRAVRLLPGPTPERALEIAEKMLAAGKKPLAIAWARQAENKAKAVGKTGIQRRAQEIVKFVRGEAYLKLAGGMGDVDGVVLGRMMGLW